jgi:hypothetical protein
MIKFGMETLNITQGRYNDFSHEGINASDLAGKDSGIEAFVAYTDFKVVQKFENQYGNGVTFQSVYKITFKDGREDYVTLLMWHDNYIGDVTIGEIIKSGHAMFGEGTSGYATGNHIHLECAKGKQYASSMLPDYGTHLPNWTNIENVFYIGKDQKVINNGGYSFMVEKSTTTSTPSSTKYYFKVSASTNSGDISKYKCRAIRNTKGAIKLELECVNDTYIFKNCKMTDHYTTVNNFGKEEWQKDTVQCTGKVYTTVMNGYNYLVHQILWADAPDGYAYVAYKKYK